MPEGGEGEKERCSYGKCDRPDESSKFHNIEEGRTAGGQDWSSLVGKTLCTACYQRYKRRGTLDREKRSKKEGGGGGGVAAEGGGSKDGGPPKERVPKRRLTESEGKCMYDGCDRPDESSKFHHIEEGKSAGGRDWSTLVGKVLCHACYMRFYSSGALERASKRRLADSARKCTYEQCEKPEGSPEYHPIEEGRKAGGRDWSALTGAVLCNACYYRFHKRGTLERKRKRGNSGGPPGGGGPPNKIAAVEGGAGSKAGATADVPVVDKAVAATVEGGSSSSSSSKAPEGGGIKVASGSAESGGGIKDGSTAAEGGGSGGGKANGAAEVKDGATAEKKKYNRRLAEEARKCTYSGCDRTDEGNQFLQIDEHKTAGGQDWSSLVGQVLCAACYMRYYKRGTLERANNKPLVGEARRCTYEHCDKSGDRSKFHHIELGRKAGGQDWGPLVGKVLCTACYMRYYRRGTLEKEEHKAKGSAGSKGVGPKKVGGTPAKGDEPPASAKPVVAVAEPVGIKATSVATAVVTAVATPVAAAEGGSKEAMERGGGIKESVAGDGGVKKGSGPAAEPKKMATAPGSEGGASQANSGAADMGGIKESSVGISKPVPTKNVPAKSKVPPVTTAVAKTIVSGKPVGTVEKALAFSAAKKSEAALAAKAEKADKKGVP